MDRKGVGSIRKIKEAEHMATVWSWGERQQESSKVLSQGKRQTSQANHRTRTQVREQRGGQDSEYFILPVLAPRFRESIQVDRSNEQLEMQENILFGVFILQPTMGIPKSLWLSESTGEPAQSNDFQAPPPETLT